MVAIVCVPADSQADSSFDFSRPRSLHPLSFIILRPPRITNLTFVTPLPYLFPHPGRVNRWIVCCTASAQRTQFKFFLISLSFFSPFGRQLESLSFSVSQTTSRTSLTDWSVSRLAFVGVTPGITSTLEENQIHTGNGDRLLA